MFTITENKTCCCYAVNCKQKLIKTLSVLDTYVCTAAFVTFLFAWYLGQPTTIQRLCRAGGLHCGRHSRHPPGLPLPGLCHLHQEVQEEASRGC